MNVVVSRLLPIATTLALALPAPVLAASNATPQSFPTPASARVHPATTASTPTASTPTAAATTTTPATTRAAPSRTLTAPGSSAVSPFNRTPPNTRVRAPAHSSGSVRVSTEAIVLAAIAALLLLACAAWAFARSRAYEPHWLVSMRHAMAEAGFRTSATWAEFTDWVRLGR
jgi:hypothetical protein